MALPTNYFGLLQQPRRPWLEAEAVKESFHRAMSQHHPDVTGDGGASAELNAAYTMLKEPAARLRHLLELEFPQLLSQPAAIPATVAEHFPQVASCRARVDAFLKKRAEAEGVLARALLAEEEREVKAAVQTEREFVTARQAACESVLRALNEEWSQQDPGKAEAVLHIQQELVYLAKWAAQWKEAEFQLAT